MEVVQSEILLKSESARHLGEDLPCGRALKIEDTEGVPPVKDLHRFGIVNGIPARVIDPTAVILFHQIKGIPDDGQTPVAQDIYLDQSCLFHRILFPLEHLGPIGRDLYRAVAAYLIRHNNQAPAVDREVIEVVLKLNRRVQDLIPGLGELDPPHLWMVCKVLPDLLQPPAETHSAGDAADLRIGQPEYLCHFPDGRLGPVGIVVGHHGSPAVSVFGKEIVNDLLPLIPCEVHIYVRWIHPPGIKEALKKEVVLNGVHVGDTQGVGDDGCGRASPAA